MKIRAVSGVVLAFALLALAACASIPPTNYYVLGLSARAEPAPNTAEFPYSLRIERFESDPILMRKKIVWRSGSNQMGYYSYEKWGALPAEMFSYRLYERAREAGLFTRVYPADASHSADLVLRGKVVAFEGLEKPEQWFGHVEVWAELARRDGTVLWSGEASHTEPASGKSVEAAVRAIATATEATITEILSSIGSSLAAVE